MNDSSKPSDEKANLRQEIKLSRSRLSNREYQDKSAAISARLIRFVTEVRFDAVLAFWPVVEKREPDIRPFLLHLLVESLPLYLCLLHKKLSY